MTRRTLLLLLPVALVAGCGSPTTGVVSGTVLYKGAPLKGGTVTFSPKPPTEDVQPVTVELDENGRYATNPLPYGEWLVGVAPARGVDESLAKPENPSLPTPPKPAPPAWVQKYGDPLKSGLAVTLGEPSKAFPIDMN